MKSCNLFEVEIGYLRGIMNGMAWHNVSHFLESVHNQHNGVLAPLSSWQTRDEIQANVFPWGYKHGQGGVKVMR